VTLNNSINMSTRVQQDIVRNLQVCVCGRDCVIACACVRVGVVVCVCM